MLQGYDKIIIKKTSREDYEIKSSFTLHLTRQNTRVRCRLKGFHLNLTKTVQTQTSLKKLYWEKNIMLSRIPWSTLIQVTDTSHKEPTSLTASTLTLLFPYRGAFKNNPVFFKYSVHSSSRDKDLGAHEQFIQAGLKTKGNQPRKPAPDLITEHPKGT